MSGRHAWIDASAGVAGDMLLAALVDAGADLAAVQETVDLVIPGAVRITGERVTRAGLRALHVDVRPLVDDPPHRTWREIETLLAALPEPVRKRATAVFARLAEVEAHVHDVPVADVHFHEVGALDSIADVVGVCAALEALGITTVSAGEVALGSGRVRTAHGELPVPAPAVAELARGWRVRAGGRGELATPTGMAVVRALSATCEDLPAMTVDAIGVGAGSRDFPGRANVTRVVIGGLVGAGAGASAGLSGSSGLDAGVGRAAADLREPGSAEPGSAEPGSGGLGSAELGSGGLGSGELGSGRLGSGEPGSGGLVSDRLVESAVLLEANVDDLDPRLWPGVLAGLLAGGASDAWLVPILMKKGRPAHTLAVLCPPHLVPKLRAQIFQDTTTLGVRESARRKTALDRLFVKVALPGGAIAVKIGHTNGAVVQVMPEFADVAALARRTGRPERLVLQEAMQAATAAGLVVGQPLPSTLP